MNSNKASYLENVAIFWLFLLFVLACAPLFVNNLPYLDDYYLVAMQKQRGFWAPTEYFQSMWGSYRLIYTTLMSPLYSLSDKFWAVRTVGLLMHVASTGLLYLITTNFGWKKTSRLLVVSLFLFFPYSLESIAWPSNVTQYPLAPLVALGGAALIICPQTAIWKLFIGAVLLGASVWIHEQIGSIVIFLLIVSCIGQPKRIRWFLATTTLGIVIANFLLIFITRADNIRLTGENGASLDNLTEHIDFAPQLIRTTPLGDLYYSTGGVGPSYIFLLALCAGLLVFVTSLSSDDMKSVGGGQNSLTWNNPTAFFPFAVILAVGAYLVSLIPIMLSPVPWHTARVIYIPFLAFTFAMGFLAECLLSLKPVVGRFFRWVLSFLLFAIVVWSPIALKAEADALDIQVHVNFNRAQDLAGLIGEEVFTTNTVVIVGGFPYSDNRRPLFGEHFIGMTLGEIKVALGMIVKQPPKFPILIGAANWDHLCKGSDGNIQLKDVNNWAEVTSAMKNKDNIIFALWSDGNWFISRGILPPVNSLVPSPQLGNCLRNSA